jgi:hypothetical protein
VWHQIMLLQVNAFQARLHVGTQGTLQVANFMELNANMVLPAVVKFEGVDSAVSVYRLATFTGTRFFRSCALNVHSNTPAASAPAQPMTRSSSNHSAHSMPSRANSTAAAAAAAGCVGVSPGRTAAGIFAASNTGESDVVLSSPVAPKVGSAPTMLSSGLCDEGPASIGVYIIQASVCTCSAAITTVGTCA